ncbi:MAG: DcaP family trimeric outer membrane transporter, partial [Caulobacterales bacterium]|nr:DcaP family trimeric outer membrane transporter [Caulobacterales bacterium]
MRLGKSWLVGTVAAAALAATASPAEAQTPEELAAKVAALEAALAELKSELAAQEARTDETVEDIERLEAREPVAAPGDGSKPVDGFMVGDTRVKVGGFIDLDVNVTDTSDGEIVGGSIARDFYIPSATPVGGMGEDTPDTDFTAESTRLYITTATERAGHAIGSRLELDFLGSAQGNELVSNSFSPRLRHAFVTVDNWLAGQTWSTFQNTSSIPESASFLALSDGMVFVRQPQVRYTRGPWQFSLENPDTREFSTGERDDGFAPDMVAKYTAKGEWGNASFAALGRYLVAERPNGANGADEMTGFGWGLSAAGDVNVTDQWGVKFSLTGGEGVGRYIGLAAIADERFDADGDLDPIASVGGLLALHGEVAPKTRVTLGYSGLFADAELGETKSVQSVLGVIARDIA